MLANTAAPRPRTRATVRGAVAASPASQSRPRATERLLTTDITSPDVLPLERNMAVRRINEAIKKLDMKVVKEAMLVTDTQVYVCDAPEEDWRRYVRSESQALVSRAMMWKAGKIYIVELPGSVHETAVCALNTAMLMATHTGDDYLYPRGAAYVDEREHIEPDLSYGPERGIGAVLPQGLAYITDFHTLKIEIGVSRGWPQLNEKAEKWRQFPGVEYILSVRLSPKLKNRSFRLDSVVNGAFATPRMAPRAIDNTAQVAMDSRRLLALPAHVALPAAFPNPFVIDLFAFAQKMLRRFAHLHTQN